MLMGTQIQIALLMRIFLKSQICACCTQSSLVLNICSNNGNIHNLYMLPSLQHSGSFICIQTMLCNVAAMKKPLILHVHPKELYIFGAGSSSYNFYK